jgi:2-polyprenyl-3-methyl-5-hydroxy-6-metoxy-1,4-benzoquinol methylase
MSVELSERQRLEKIWHDEKYRHAPLPVSAGRMTLANQRFWELIGQPHGQTILDFGCGNGWLSVMLAERGNEVHGFDISEVLVQQAKERAAAANVPDRALFKEMAAENLDYAPDMFDLVVGSSILHHTDLEVTLRHISRIIKPTGRAIFLEPLNQNIVLQLWRLVTPWRRTETERALTRGDLQVIRRVFPRARLRFFIFSSIVTTGLLVMAPENPLLRGLNDWMEKLDEKFLEAVPGLGRFSAVVVLELRK